MLHEASMCFGSVGSCSDLGNIISPGFGWNTETIDSFDQLKAKMRNNYQSNATASIPYTGIYRGQVIDSV